MKLGVLYPRSQAHPQITQEFVQGIRKALEVCGPDLEINLVMESVGYGGSEKEVYEKVEKLIVLEQVDILVAYIDQRVLDLLVPLLYANGKLLIVINPGANYPENWVPQSNIIYLTLQQSFCCWLTGLAAARSKEGAAMATSFLDAGYLHIAAITNGFTKNGGHISYNFVNKNIYDPIFEIKFLVDFLQTGEVKKLLCVFDSLLASRFYEQLNKYEKSSELQLYVSPMMLERSAWKEHILELNFSIHGYLPYFPGLDNETNVQFKNAFSNLKESEPSIFHLQGWESAMLIIEIMKRTNDFNDGSRIVELLEGIELATPRGKLSLDKETNFFIAPVFKGELQKKGEDLRISAAGNLLDEWKKFVAEPLTGPTSGWTNTYLCY